MAPVRPLTVEVIGSAGIGKSTLVEAVARRMAARGHRVEVARPTAHIVRRGWRTAFWTYLVATWLVFVHLRPRFRTRADWRRLPRRIASTPVALANDAGGLKLDLLLMDEVGACFALLALASRSRRLDFDVAPLLASRWWREGAPMVVIFLHLDRGAIIARRVERDGARAGAAEQRNRIEDAIDRDARCLGQLWCTLAPMAEGGPLVFSVDNSRPVDEVAAGLVEILSEMLAQRPKAPMEASDARKPRG